MMITTSVVTPSVWNSAETGKPAKWVIAVLYYYDRDIPSITSTLASATGTNLPIALSIDIMHATRGGTDVNLLLTCSRQGLYYAPQGLYYAPLANRLPAGPWELRLSNGEFMDAYKYLKQQQHIYNPGYRQGTRRGELGLGISRL